MLPWMTFSTTVMQPMLCITPHPHIITCRLIHIADPGFKPRCVDTYLRTCNHLHHVQHPIQRLPPVGLFGEQD